MDAIKLLQKIGLKSDDIIFSITKEEAADSLLEFIKEWGLKIKINKIKKEEWNELLKSYADAVTDYHPEDYHQERIVFLNNQEMLIKYGLTDSDISRLDFC